jgi:threonine dehydratase
VPTLDDVRAARARIEGEVVLTPCTRSPSLEEWVPGRLHLKFENLQRTGSFKERGALNRLLHLSPEERAAG